MKNIRTGILIIVSLFSLSNKTAAQFYDFDSLYQQSPYFKNTIDAIKDTFDIFNSEALLKVTIRSDFKNLIKKKFQNDYQPAILETEMFDSLVIRRNIKIKPRGEYRRENCYYPPIMLNFSKKEAVFKQFEEFDKVKFVGNCQSGDLYDTYLLEEYYIYKMYNLLTPFSLRVRLLKVRYVDTSGKKKPRENFAFILENVNQMAKRNNGVNFNQKGITSKMIDRDVATIMDIFQLMIGNTDYAVPVLHNVKLIKTAYPDHPRPIPVPYDFDYSGIINAFYAIPGEHLPIKNVRQRYFMGACREMEEYQQTFEIFHENRKAMEALFDNSPYLPENNKKLAIRYMDEFYNIIDSEGSVKYVILNNCRR